MPQENKPALILLFCTNEHSFLKEAHTIRGWLRLLLQAVLSGLMLIQHPLHTVTMAEEMVWDGPFAEMLNAFVNIWCGGLLKYLKHWQDMYVYQHDTMLSYVHDTECWNGANCQARSLSCESHDQLSAICSPAMHLHELQTLYFQLSLLNLLFFQTGILYPRTNNFPIPFLPFPGSGDHSSTPDCFRFHISVRLCGMCFNVFGLVPWT